MREKSLKEISWDVTEEQYRNDAALSYSTLAKYERQGFNDLDKLFDKVESPSLTFGSAVDSIITGGQEEFDNRFMVAEFPSIPDSVIKIIKQLFTEYGKEGACRTLDSIPNINAKLLLLAEHFNYQPNWKPETRVKVIKERGTDYYNLLYIAGDRTILDTNTYQDVCNAVEVLKNSESTSYYFDNNNPFDPTIERLYQLKFKATLNGINYRCMADLIAVNYANKTIQPIDLKTSGHAEWDFYKSFIDWSY